MCIDTRHKIATMHVSIESRVECVAWHERRINAMQHNVVQNSIENIMSNDQNNVNNNVNNNATHDATCVCDACDNARIATMSKSQRDAIDASKKRAKKIDAKTIDQNEHNDALKRIENEKRVLQQQIDALMNEKTNNALNVHASQKRVDTNDASREKRVNELLRDLRDTTNQNDKKRIRSKLRRMNYYISRVETHDVKIDANVLRASNATKNEHDDIVDFVYDDAHENMTIE